MFHCLFVDVVQPMFTVTVTNTYKVHTVWNFVTGVRHVCIHVFVDQ